VDSKIDTRVGQGDEQGERVGDLGKMDSRVGDCSSRAHIWLGNTHVEKDIEKKGVLGMQLQH